MKQENEDLKKMNKQLQKMMKQSQMKDNNESEQK